MTLRLDRRMDTGRWLEVTGDVRSARGLVWIEATEIRTAAPVDEPETETVSEALLPPPAPTVIFSAPTSDELGVSRNATVRVQFSRDMAPDSFKGHVNVRYLSRDSAEPPPATMAAKVDYDAGRRVLEITFTSPLDPLRTVEVLLGEGITSMEDRPLAPWTLRFTVGG